MEETAEVKKNSLEDSKAEQVLSILTAVEKIFKVQEVDSKAATVIESQLVSKPRDKKLKETKSWCTNGLIRLYHSHQSIKEAKKMPEFIKSLKENTDLKKALSEARIEDSGYITFIDMTADD